MSTLYDHQDARSYLESALAGFRSALGARPLPSNLGWVHILLQATEHTFEKNEISNLERTTYALNQLKDRVHLNKMSHFARRLPEWFEFRPLGPVAPILYRSFDFFRFLEREYPVVKDGASAQGIEAHAWEHTGREVDQIRLEFVELFGKYTKPTVSQDKSVCRRLTELAATTAHSLSHRATRPLRHAQIYGTRR
ncbi:hypothetical protein JCM10212_002582 [Sporobolomyces blumeae]